MAGNILYQQGLGNALGSALGQGAQAFQERGDFLDQKNYDRNQAAMIDKKKDAGLLYNHLGSMLEGFEKMQLAGGQNNASPLEKAQAQEAASKVKKIQGLLTSGKYDEGMKAYEEFQAHVSQVEGPAPTDGQGKQVAGPGAPVQQNGLDVLNNQTSQGNEMLGSLALRKTTAGVLNDENAAVISGADAGVAQERAGVLLRSLKATTTVQEVEAQIAKDTQALASAAKIAEYLGTIADQGGIGSQAAAGYLQKATPEVQAAFAVRSKQADQVRTTAVGQAAANLNMTTQQVESLTEQRPWLLNAMKWGVAKQGQEYWQADKLNPINVKQAQADLDAAQFKLTEDKELSPDKKALLHAQLGVTQSQLAIQQATQSGVIKGTNSQNYALLAENNQVADFEAMVKDGTMTQAEADLWIGLANQKDEARQLAIKTARATTRTAEITAEVGDATKQDVIKGVHYDTALKGYESIAAKYKALYAPETEKANASSATSTATINRENARTAGPLADAQLQIAQGQGKTAFSAGMHAYALDDANVKNAQGQATITAAKAAEAPAQEKAQTTILLGQGKLIGAQAEVAQRTVGTAVQTAQAQLSGLLLDNTGKGLSNEFETKSMGSRLQALTLGNKLTTANIGQVYQQIMTMKQERQQAKIKFPKDLAALDAALEYTKAQANKLALESSAGNDIKAQISILQQQRIISDGDLKDAQQGIARFIPNAKFGVDQFDPSNYSTMTAKLSVEQKAELKKAIDNYNNVMTDRKGIQTALSTLGKSLLPNSGNSGGGNNGTGFGKNAPASGLPPAEINHQIDLMFTSPDHGLLAKLATAKRIGAGDWFADNGPLRAYNGYGTADGKVSTAAGSNWKNPDYVNTIKSTAGAKPWVAAMQQATGARKAELQQINAGFEATAKKYGIPADVVKAISWHESAGWQPAIVASDGNGAGLGQTTGYFPPTAQQTPAGTPQPASQTTKPPVPAGNPGTQYKTAGGGNYVSHTLSLPQMKLLDTNGFFKAAQKITDLPSRDAFLQKYGQLLYGGANAAQGREQLYDLAKQVAAGGK